jgi:hypothetical protein
MFNNKNPVTILFYNLFDTPISILEDQDKKMFRQFGNSAITHHELLLNKKRAGRTILTFKSSWFSEFK